MCIKEFMSNGTFVKEFENWEQVLNDYKPEIEDMVESKLNFSSPAIEVAGIRFEAGDCLRQLDPVAFNQVVCDEIDNIQTDIDFNSRTGITHFSFDFVSNTFVVEED